MQHDLDVFTNHVSVMSDLVGEDDVMSNLLSFAKSSIEFGQTTGLAEKQLVLCAPDSSQLVLCAPDSSSIFQISYGIHP